MSNDTNADGSEFTAADLAGDVEKTVEAPRGAQEIKETAAATEAEAHASYEKERAFQAKQNTSWRRILFWGISLLVALVAGVTLIGFIYYLVVAGAEADPAVISTWIGGSVIQTVGLLLVVTRHLFPKESAAPAAS